jgi:signal transduction histidine kinase
MEIRDHGRGMPARVLQQVDGQGSKWEVGLAGMRERIHELGGSFEVSSDAGGTCVRAVIPLGVNDELSSLGAGVENVS